MVDNNKWRYRVYLPIIISVVLVLGMFIGFWMNNSKAPQFILGRGNGKIDQVMRLIDKQYLDTINPDNLYNVAIEALLNDLDPYSAYIPAADFDLVNEPLEGNFEGIGVEFYILNDTVLVVSAISGGPSENVGIRAGDKILEVDGTSFAGVGMVNENVVKKLRGASGTKVKIKMLRGDKEIDFVITRGKIPLNSVEVTYMLNSEVGYIKLTKFSATSGQEVAEAIAKLQEQGMQDLIFDLRGNPGGYLNAAIQIADEFLSKGRLITYTEGRTQPRKNYESTNYGSLEHESLVVLVDEGSASASEIVSGAVQDWDRGVIIGRRTFGKGLVQEQFIMSDGSAVRLTVAKYFTPTGRSIQKPYNDGSMHARDLDLRYEHGELFYKDSIQFNDSLKYFTPGGRTVFGGGGIMPDVFVPADSNKYTDYLNELVFKGIINQFAYNYADANRRSLEKFGSAQKYADELVMSEQALRELAAYAEKEGITKKLTSGNLVEREELAYLLKLFVGRQIYGAEGFSRVYVKKDKVIDAALSHLAALPTESKALVEYLGNLAK